MSEIISSDIMRAQAEALKIKPKHYELALAEQAMRRANGRSMSIDEILHRNGFASGARDNAKNKGGSKEDLTMQALRLYVPSAAQAAMGLCLLELRTGVLRIAIGDRVDDADLLRISQSLARANHEVSSIEAEPWDRAELTRLMREQSEMAGDRLLRILAALARDPDDAMLVEQATHDILAEALQSRTSDIHLSLKEDDARC
jgi:type II secretory ATPase GspE/PulE/Tfp pilus assembly ATPase PilB-like protein